MGLKGPADAGKTIQDPSDLPSKTKSGLRRNCGSIAWYALFVRPAARGRRALGSTAVRIALVASVVVLLFGARTIASYAIEVGFNPSLLPRPYVSECGKCGWQSPEIR